ncbi:hypothetical protein DS2_11023 [Catenovulum agarivorans DS-2]|uniref:Uncharacterized protein n=1 Tax=Catenovulum agarivorans DS-2 TaxID=1328313 RepID=W7QLJ7_9ALTE|nr:hypothetical protein [Catenovulum agarivorans]EWH09812.1 hypothetical protein DS2_11023 [Catenovulum agarivorans DS-2]
MKILTGLILIVTIAGYVLFSSDSIDAAKPQKAEVQQKQPVKIEPNNLNDEPQPTVNPTFKVESKIAQLEQKIRDRHAEITNITGPDSGKNTMRYEDNWCNAREDLTEQDQIYAAKKMEEWKLIQGERIHSSNSNNAEYLKPYIEEDIKTLIQLAKKDDVYALASIIRHPEATSKLSSKAAKRLLILGHSGSALGTLIARELVSAKHSKGTDNNKYLVSLKRALIYTEFGLMRNNVSNLVMLLSSVQQNQKDRNDGVNLADLQQIDFNEIHESAKALYQRINEYRANMGLDSFEEIDDNKEAEVDNSYKLFAYNNIVYKGIMDSPLFPTTWKSLYLKSTHCYKRYTEMHKFKLHELPAIKKEIAELKEPLVQFKQ